MKFLINFIIIVVLIFKTLDIMDCTDFENLLGKNISNAVDFIGKDFENNLFEKNFYYIKDESINKNIDGMSFNSISFQTDKNEIIEAITVNFSTLINQKFYDQLIKIYGYPNEIKIIQKREKISSGFIKDEIFSQEVKKNNIELRDGSFEEKPLFIIWKKNNFNITLFFRYNEDRSEIIFKNKTI